MHIVAIVTDEQMMRGVNYRAPNKGITLFEAQKFTTYRNQQQGRARVNRFGDYSYRIAVKKHHGVDHDRYYSLLRKIHQV